MQNLECRAFYVKHLFYSESHESVPGLFIVRLCCFKVMNILVTPLPSEGNPPNDVYREEESPLHTTHATGNVML